jgi:hypothetical protein
MKKFIENLKGIALDKNFGAKVPVQSPNAAILFLVVLMSILGSAYLIKGNIGIYDSVKEFRAYMTTDFPDFELKDGVFTCSVDTVYKKVNDNGAIIIDTHGHSDLQSLNDYEEGMVVTSSQLLLKQKSGEIKGYEFKNIKLNFDKEKLLNFTGSLLIPIIVIFFLLGLVFVFLSKMIGVLVLSILALIINAIVKGTNKFDTLFRISIYAIAYPTILDYILDIAGVDIPGFKFIYYGVAVMFLTKLILSTVKGNDETAIVE